MQRICLLALGAGGVLLFGCTTATISTAQSSDALAKAAAREVGTPTASVAAGCFLAWRDASGDFASGIIAPDGTLTLLAVYEGGARVRPTPTPAELAKLAR